MSESEHEAFERLRDEHVEAIKMLIAMQEAGNALADAAEEMGAYPKPEELLQLFEAVVAWREAAPGQKERNGE